MVMKPLRGLNGPLRDFIVVAVYLPVLTESLLEAHVRALGGGGTIKGGGSCSSLLLTSCSIIVELFTK